MFCRLFRLCVAPLCLIFLQTVKGNHDGPFIFQCHGKAEVAMLEDGVALKEICGEDYRLSFNNSDGSVTGAHLKLFFSSMDEYDTQDSVLLMEEVISGPSNIWEYHGMDNINQADMPCGTGFLVATIVDTNVYHVEAERAVRICDNSDIDLELWMSSPLSSHLYLIPDSDHLLQQLYSQIGYPVHFGVKNHGKMTLRNTTAESSHMVGFYLRLQNASNTKHDHCEIPETIVGDAFLGAMSFTNGIEAGETYMFDHTPENMINISFDDQPAICGDAELVIMVDPLLIENDRNPCNNFLQMPVHVSCTQDQEKEKCKIFPNYVMRGHEINALFSGNGKGAVYEYKTPEEKEWRKKDPGDYDDRIGLKGMMRMDIAEKMLKHLYEYPEKGLCKWVNRMYPENEKDSIPEKTMDMDESDPTDPKVIDVMNNLKALKNEIAKMSSPRDMDKDFNTLEMKINVTTDMVWKQKMMGKIIGLKLAAGYKHAVMNAYWTGQPVPEHYLRSVFMMPMMGLASTMHHIGMLPDGMKKMVVLQSLPYAAALNVMLELLTVPRDVESKLHRVLYHMKMMMRDLKPATGLPSEMPTFSTIVPGMSSSPSGILKSTTPPPVGVSSWLPKTCPFEMTREIESAHPISLELYHLVHTAREGEKIPFRDGSKLEHCHRYLLSTYLKYGGARVQSKDIVAHFKKNMGKHQDVPMSCRQHPILPAKIFPVSWKVYKDRIMTGSMSPWTGNMHWWTVALCRCHMCGSGNNTRPGDNHGYTDKSYGTTDPYGYMHQTTDNSVG